MSVAASCDRISRPLGWHEAQSYLETTIPSYLTSRPSRDVVIAAHQQITREWSARAVKPSTCTFLSS